MTPAAPVVSVDRTSFAVVKVPALAVPTFNANTLSARAVTRILEMSFFICFVLINVFFVD